MQTPVANRPLPTNVPVIALVDPATGEMMGSGTRASMKTDILAELGKAKRIVLSASSQSVTLEATTTKVSIEAVGGPARFAVGTGTVTATNANDNGVTHYLGNGGRLDFRVVAGSKIAAIKDLADASGVSLEITELV